MEYTRLDLYFLSKYVDHILTVLEKLGIGTRWEAQANAFIWSHKEDENKDLEKLKTEQICTMASSTMGCLNYTFDSQIQTKMCQS